MKLLAIDTSGLVCAVAVIRDGVLLAEYRTQYKKTHSQMLMPMLDALAKAIDLEMNTLDYVAVAAGPGSFTGLRIGAATAIGLASALGIPIVPVSTLDALAWQLCGEEGVVCPLMDARRGQVYTGIYRFRRGPRVDASAPFAMETIFTPTAVSVSEVADRLNDLGEPAVFLGDGVPPAQETLSERLQVPYRFAPLWKNRQSAAALADLAARYAKEGKAVQADAFRPVYLRASQAEREAKEKKAREAAGGEESTHACPPEIELRRMLPADAAAEAARETACLGREAWSERLLAEAADRRDSVYLVAVFDGRSIGHAGIRNVCGEGEITNVCVDEAWRRQGVGERMLRELLAQGKALGIEACTLEVRQSNTAAIRLYEKLGFVCAGARPGFYEEPREDALIYDFMTEKQD
ncbi:MAG: tRNA (adenosine(37)-N6)-threonylcarbamoyltransferase complex dimerization subunit type 1 TsaB [Lachnospiraceae bacterium]|nr:tRNA (adenosine(37)-N6)-threonylcarbamoyltransferase complex dimerization subunit type 1 TsaB [Lachnospiraceae bacterium]